MTDWVVEVCQRSAKVERSISESYEGCVARDRPLVLWSPSAQLASSLRVSSINAGSGIDIWHGAGPSANSSKRSRSLHLIGRAANCDWPPSTPDRRLWIVESDFRTSGSMPRVDRTNATDVPFC